MSEPQGGGPVTMGVATRDDCRADGSDSSAPEAASLADDAGGRLIRALISRVGRAVPERPSADLLDGTRVVVELEVDGVRYVLLEEDAPTASVPVSLTSREREIARMIARGHTNRTIAAVLEISPWTVSTHLRRIFAKLDVSSRAAMVGLLTLQGLIDERDGRPREPGPPARSHDSPLRSSLPS